MSAGWWDFFTLIAGTCWDDRATLTGSSLEMCKSYVQMMAFALQAGGAIIAALIVGLLGGLITFGYNVHRTRQDRESQWRNHAIELTKLDLQRKLSSRTVVTNLPIQPSIHDFLNNYRQLKKLDSMTVEAVYNEIVTKHTDTNPPPYYNPTIMAYAVEIAKLDSKRDEKLAAAEGVLVSRSNVLNVLANYHELEQLVQQRPEKLWHSILNDRFAELADKQTRKASTADPAVVDAPAAPAVASAPTS